MVLRFLNNIVVAETPIAEDFGRWRRTLEAYRIDGKPVFDPSRGEDRMELDRLISWQAAGDRKGLIESCPEILVRTAGMRPVTDDNMGSEWRYFLGFE
ncbi:MAG: hypothetical protein JO084_02925 [Bradyrhizobiaceae bacterium]|nr:hypothetical protein [Bradyrhizobiaceae bacterium]